MVVGGNGQQPIQMNEKQ